MIRAYGIDGTGRKTTAGDAAGIEKIRGAGGTVWVDVERPTRDELQSLKEPFGLTDDSIDDGLGGEQRPRIDEYENYLSFVLYGAIGPEQEIKYDPRKLVIFFGRGFLITVHGEPLKTIERLRERAEKDGDRVLEKGMDHLLYSIIDSLADNFLLVADDYDEALGELEEISASVAIDTTLPPRILELRKELLDLRRLAATQRDMLLPIVAGDFDEISESLENKFRHVRDHLTQVIEAMDNLRELLHGVRDNYQTQLANRANSVMQTLTIFASLFLPMSLIAGIYGMNTGLWPPVDSPMAFWYIIGAMGVVVLVMLGFFHHKKWF